MPHLTIEYTDNLAASLNTQALMGELIGALEKTGTVDVQTVMCRAVCLSDWRMGNGESQHAFVHVRLAALDRRPPEFKKQVIALFSPLLKSVFDRARHGLDCQVCVEIQDIRTEFYDKFVA